MPGPQALVCHRIRLFGECLARALTETATLHCTAIDPQGLVPQLAELPPEAAIHLLLLDPTLAAGDTPLVADLVRQRFPGCKLLLLVSEAATDQLVELAYLGSQGCVGDDVVLDELRSAIEVVLSGRPYCSPPLANALFAQLRPPDPDHRWGDYLSDARLTDREREILRMITLEQLANKQIARRLHVSLYTVKNHVHNILEKLGVEDRYQAARVARNQRLLMNVEPGR